MDFGFDARTEDYRKRLLAFMDEHVYPVESSFAAHEGWEPPPLLAGLQTQARQAGLWNLFLPGEHGAGLSNLQYAPLAEITGRSPSIAPAALNCAAPDTGNMEVLSEFGNAEQREQWLKPR
jgi:alkylation response protein AidB-like acyl-CoA dehydrogenase